MNIFGIIGPVMIGPSSSHTAGAARIGYVARKILAQEPDVYKRQVMDVYFIKQGVLRGYYFDENGREITECISGTPGMAFMPGFDWHEPARINIGAAAAGTQVFAIPVELADAMMANRPEIRQVYVEQDVYKRQEQNGHADDDQQVLLRSGLVHHHLTSHGKHQHLDDRAGGVLAQHLQSLNAQDEGCLLYTSRCV